MKKIQIELFALSSSLPKDSVIELARKHGFQVFDSDAVASKFQLELAYLHAVEAFNEKRNITNDLMMEWLVRASGKRQIKEAIHYIGCKNPNKILIGFDKEKTSMTKKKILEIIKGKEIKWKEKNDEEIIGKMVELEIEE